MCQIFLPASSGRCSAWAVSCAGPQRDARPCAQPDCLTWHPACLQWQMCGSTYFQDSPYCRQTCKRCQGCSVPPLQPFASPSLVPTTSAAPLPPPRTLSAAQQSVCTCTDVAPPPEPSCADVVSLCTCGWTEHTCADVVSHFECWGSPSARPCLSLQHQLPVWCGAAYAGRCKCLWEKLGSGGETRSHNSEVSV